MTGRAVTNVGDGQPRKITISDGKYITMKAKRERKLISGIIAQKLCTATGRQIHRFTVVRHFHKGALYEGV